MKWGGGGMTRVGGGTNAKVCRRYLLFFFSLFSICLRISYRTRYICSEGGRVGILQFSGGKT